MRAHTSKKKTVLKLIAYKSGRVTQKRGAISKRANQKHTHGGGSVEFSDSKINVPEHPSDGDYRTHLSPFHYNNTGPQGVIVDCANPEPIRNGSPQLR